MSGHIVPKSMLEVSSLYTESRVIFDALTDMMLIQPDIDPDAGYGIFQGATQFLNLELEKLKGEKLIERTGYDNLKLYILLRSHYMGGVARAELDQFIDGEIELDYQKMYKDLLNFIPKFKKRGVLSRLS